MAKGKNVRPLSQLLRVPEGGIDLSTVDAAATPQAPGGKSATKDDQAQQAPLLADLQERLFANGRSGAPRSFLLVLQGLDSSGKGGTIKHVVGQVDPQGVIITAFKAPTPAERRRDFLWRIRRRLPEPGMLGVFDRSHYEDVVTVRVRELAPRSVWSRRFGAIDRFERGLAEDGMAILKCYLHISRAEFTERQLARLDDPTKHWKYNPGDLDVYRLWDDYLEAYSEVLGRCNPQHAPWYVIPADRKWYRNWAVTKLLMEALDGMGLEWPKADFDVEAERGRVEALGQSSDQA
jgi:PPK2 family polyphosphate:nucleotide phosphotransferase